MPSRFAFVARQHTAGMWRKKEVLANRLLVAIRPEAGTSLEAAMQRLKKRLMLFEARLAELSAIASDQKYR